MDIITQTIAGPRRLTLEQRSLTRAIQAQLVDRTGRVVEIGHLDAGDQVHIVSLDCARTPSDELTAIYGSDRCRYLVRLSDLRAAIV